VILHKPEPANGKAPAGRLWDRLSKTRGRLTDRINTLITGKKVIDQSLLEDLEEILFTSDIGVETTGQLIEGLKKRVGQKSLEKPELLKAVLKEQMISFLDANQGPSIFNVPEKLPGALHVIMVVGVNGVGKTTTIAKMAHYSRAQGQKVMLVAADTFRAAAIEQLQIWGDRVGADVISQKRGSDPGAVVFDAISAAKARRIDKVFIDTAGRLHTNSNLMEELKKIHGVAVRLISKAPHQVTLILDATTGQNAIAQAHEFAQSLGVTDIILTKLDGTAKGGIVIGISQRLRIPISFICTGEGLEDLEIFNPREFVDAIFA
jgi:fused signal recognition particle receptor